MFVLGVVVVCLFVVVFLGVVAVSAVMSRRVHITANVYLFVCSFVRSFVHSFIPSSCWHWSSYKEVRYRYDPYCCHGWKGTPSDSTNCVVGKKVIPLHISHQLREHLFVICIDISSFQHDNWVMLFCPYNRAYK